MVSRVLIVSLGSIGKRHLAMAREQLPGADIRVLRHQPQAEVPEGADGSFFDLTDALAFRPDISVICNPAPFHVGAALALARAGSHLLIEKPLADRLEGAAELNRICKESGVVAMTAYNLRFLPSLNRFRELIEAKAVGAVLSVRAEVGQYLPSWRPAADYRTTVSAQKALGGGVLLELSHELDYLRWIFGEMTWVQAHLSRQSALEIDVEDTAHLICGIQGRQSRGAIVASLVLDFVRRDTTRICTAVCANGSLRWDGIAGTVNQFDPVKGVWETVFQHMPDRNASYRAEWQHWLDCINMKARPLVTIADGVRVLEIIQAARVASDKGQKVMVSSSASNMEGISE